MPGLLCWWSQRAKQALENPLASPTLLWSHICPPGRHSHSPDAEFNEYLFLKAWCLLIWGDIWVVRNQRAHQVPKGGNSDRNFFPSWCLAVAHWCSRSRSLARQTLRKLYPSSILVPVKMRWPPTAAQHNCQDLPHSGEQAVPQQPMFHELGLLSPSCGWLLWQRAYSNHMQVQNVGLVFC